MLVPAMSEPAPGCDSRLKQVWESIMKQIMRIIRDTKGATAIEYGLIAALIAVAAITAMQSLGNNLSGTFNSVSSNMTASA